jgi:hypothetical protein
MRSNIDQPKKAFQNQEIVLFRTINGIINIPPFTESKKTGLI